MSRIDVFVLKKCLDRLIDKFTVDTSVVHKRKLINIGMDNDIAPCNPDDVVYN